MAFVKRIWRFYIVIVTSLCCFESSLCKKMTFEIERRLKGDAIPNDFIINGKGEWEKWQRCLQNNCRTEFKTVKYGSARSCRCACQYAFSTFRMGATASNSSCIENSKLRSDEGCSILFQNEGTPTNSLTVIDTSKSGQNNVVFPGNSRCNTSGSALYWDYGVWKSSLEDIFLLYAPNSWTRYLKWNRITKYPGRIIKQPLTCTSISTSQTSRHCIIFKISGKLLYDLDPPTKAPTTSSTRSVGTIKTLRTQLSSTTKQPTTKRFTPSTTTSQSTPKLVTSVQTTTSRQTTHSLHYTTHNTVETSTVPVTDQTITTERHKHSTNKIASTATEDIPTEESEMPVTEVTEQSTTETDVVPGKKGARGESSDSDSSNDTLVITAIGAAAAIACVIIICIFLWFVVKRKQNNRNNEAYCSTDMTVITNGTGMNNTSVPTLKNPIYDNPAYLDSTEKHHPKQLPMLGNPVYDKAIVNNNNNNKGHPNVKNPSDERKTKIDSNHYDNEDDDEAYDNPGYQELVVKTLKGTANNAGYSDSTYDNTYAEPEKPVYEALSVNNGRDSIYQALVHNGQSTETMEPPEYLTLLDENPSPEKQDVPEYLTLVGEETNQTQPEADDYDYAYVDGQEKRTTLRTPSTKGAGMSQQDSKVYDGLNDNGPPLYDVLEDPNDKEPPVYDVLEGPDAGDDYLMPVHGNQSK
ncbi:uncharacterized protein LOC116305456 [Actinia tenebrosa]|uniref:Uncharacterized protein LOC116305456 n=1 Tax=Actinia tenebrosa TaxID=6105 RepID=A0A6P8IZ54_ACTTE|nr:uncharacterized protein LOC116305456 [Actinia tenebrosa]